MDRRTFFAACGAGVAASAMPAVVSQPRRIGSLVNSMSVDISALSAGLERAETTIRSIYYLDSDGNGVLLWNKGGWLPVEEAR